MRASGFLETGESPFKAEGLDIMDKVGIIEISVSLAELVPT